MITIYKIVDKQISAIENYLPFENNLESIYDNMWTKVGSPIIKNCSSFADINGNKLFNNALYLDGSSALYTNINLGGKDFTISFWVCPTVDKESEFNLIFLIYDLSWIQPYLLIEYQNKNFLIRSTNKSDTNIINDQNLLNTWHHIALCYNHNESKIYIYLNGKFTQTYNYSLSNNNYEFIIGTYEEKDNYFFTGYIKNFQIYNGAIRWTGNSINLSETYYTDNLTYTQKEYDVDYTYDYNVYTQRYINKKINIDSVSIRNIVKINKFIITNIKRYINKNIINKFNSLQYIELNMINKNNSVIYYCQKEKVIYDKIIRKIIKRQKFQFNKTKRYLSRKMTFKNFRISRIIEWTRKTMGYILDPNITNSRGGDNE